MIKITGGNFKRKKLDTISKFVRPTSSLKREAFFSVIESYGLKNSYNYFSWKINKLIRIGFGPYKLGKLKVGKVEKIKVLYND